ncbi:amino acid adenylation domain-containing protein [Streptomyces sp. 4F14]|uniref:amino acid adenylation domain-containing protein n=1 Tax=Streptomyces sp. 4F14 TaxID=3394380 RepID=UPI003A866A9C
MPRHSAWKRQLLHDFAETLASCDPADIDQVRHGLAQDGWNSACLPADEGGLGLTATDAACLADHLGQVHAPSDPLDALAALPLLGRIAPEAARDVRAGTCRIGVAAGQGGPAWFTGGPPDLVLWPATDTPDAVTLRRPAAVTRHPIPGDPLTAVDRPDDLAHAPAGPLWTTCALLRNAHLLGLAGAALNKAVERARNRPQFGRPIGAYQAVAFPLAEQRIRLEGLRLANDALLRDLDGTVPTDASALTDAVIALADDCVRHSVHVHGAYGLSDDSPVAACHRRLLTETARHGPSDPALPEPGRRTEPVRRQSTLRQQARLREPARGTEAVYPSDRCVHELIELAAADHPDAVAVRDHDGDLTYARLDAEAGHLADDLARRGIGAGDVVGVHMEHGAPAVTAILGVLKAGAAYLPLDPTLPPERLAFLTEDAGAALVLRDARPVTRTPERPAPRRPAAPDSLVYVLYTSGSTGTPKGVEVEHRNLTNRLYWDAATFALRPSDVVLHHTALGFDISVWEIFAPLAAGATLVVPPLQALRDPHRMLTLMRDTGVTVLACVPSLLDLLLDEDAPTLAEVSGLRYVFCGGETLPPRLVDRFHTQIATARLHNFYGPSECTIDVTSWRCDPGAGDAPVPIGTPLANVSVHVLDEYGDVVPPDRPGELYVGGAGVARGYRRRPGQTARCFLPDPFTDRPGARMYRTGDRVRRDRDGVLHFLGRTDRQVKVRGHRVELGEIQHTLERHPGVHAAAVRAVEDRIEAHVVTTDGHPPDAAGLTAHLRRTLPAHMIPAAYGFLPELPVTGNGKTDYAALPRLAPAPHDHPAEPDALRDALARLAGRLLGRERLGADDDFFAAGGSSLHAARLVARARTEHGLDVRLEHFLAAPTVRGLADSAAHAREGDPPDDR